MTDSDRSPNTQRDLTRTGARGAAVEAISSGGRWRSAPVPARDHLGGDEIVVATWPMMLSCSSAASRALAVTIMSGAMVLVFAVALVLRSRR